MVEITGKTRAALVLSLLSPFFAEVLSGSTPPLKVLTNPLSFPLLWLYYGAGVLLIREAWVRWGGGYLRLMLLGALYGVVEEGLVIRTWFNPQWYALGILGTYGRVWGINTVWAVWLTIFHSLMSVTMPIMVLDALYPEFIGKSLISGKGVKVAAVSFTGSALLFGVAMVRYKPPAIQYTLAVLLAVTLLYLAKRIHRESLIKSRFALRHPFVYGFTVASLLFLTYTALPHSRVPPVVTSLVGVLLAIHFYSQPGQLTDTGRYSLVLGFLAFWWVPYDIMLALNGLIGEAILGPLSFVWLVKVKTKKRRAIS